MATEQRLGEQVKELEKRLNELERKNSETESAAKNLLKAIRKIEDETGEYYLPAGTYFGEAVE